MEQIFQKIRHLRRVNAIHAKSGWRMHDPALTDTKVVEHAAAELVEIAAVVGAIGASGLSVADAGLYHENLTEEIADAMNCLIHLAVRHRISAEKLEAEMARKLDLRFKDIKEPVPSSMLLRYDNGLG